MGMKQRWLTPEEAKYLGIEPKPNAKGRSQARYSIKNEQYKSVLLARADNLGILEAHKEHGVDPTLSKFVWLKNKNSSIPVQNPFYEPKDEAEAFRAVLEGLKDEIKPIKPKKFKNALNNTKIINQYTLTDYHLGMMAWGEESGDDWDLKIAEKILVSFFDKAIETSPDAENCIFAQIGDFLHWDGFDAVTPANKHILDADTRFNKLVRVAIRVIRRIIDMLLNKYKTVNVIMAEGNHDPASSVWLREMLYAFYENEPRVIIDTNPDPYYCITFGKVCLFYHHGHKKSIKNVESAFIGKFKKQFGRSKFCYGHLGHFHHQEKETNLMVLEQHRTLSAKDAYASRGGYISGRDSKVITYHKNFGEVGRNTININMLK